MRIKLALTPTVRSKVIVACIAVIGAIVPFQPSLAQDNSRFEMLIVGDSHISGQGLREKDKFYSLVRDWLEDEVLDPQIVDLKVKAHAGSRISMHPEELAAMQKAGDDMNKFHYPEANISSPSIKTQIEVAPFVDLEFHVFVLPDQVPAFLRLLIVGGNPQ